MAKDLHRSAKRQEIAAHNEGFLEGVCHAIDTLHELGLLEAEEAVIAALFVKAEAPAEKKAGPHA
jgi:hypothetical protein